jgi:hypothetical protein
MDDCIVVFHILDKYISDIYHATVQFNLSSNTQYNTIYGTVLSTKYK